MNLTGYRVFIASPGGLSGERRAFRDVIQRYNEQEANPRGVHFTPVGWEQNPGGAGRPQRLIIEQVEGCDYFVLLLHDRWGTPPAAPGTAEYRGYQSGTEEEYEVARACLQDEARPMRDIFCSFKAVDPGKLSDPGEQLQRVLAFKTRIEQSRELMYREFDELRLFEELLRAKLGLWLREHEQGGARGEVPPEPPGPDSSPDPESPSRRHEPRNTADLVREAEELANEGKLIEAEALFARAIVRGDDANGFNAYGLFLERIGRLTQAQAMYERVIELGQERDDEVAQARGYGNLGNVLQTRGDLDGAEAMYRKALEINERLGWLEGMAKAYGNLGLVLQTRGDLDGAEAMYRKALEINERLGRLEGVSIQYGNLGNVLKARGDLDGAEELYRKSLELFSRIGMPHRVAWAEARLAEVAAARGNSEPPAPQDTGG